MRPAGRRRLSQQLSWRVPTYLGREATEQQSIIDLPKSELTSVLSISFRCHFLGCHHLFSFCRFLRTWTPPNSLPPSPSGFLSQRRRRLINHSLRSLSLSPSPKGSHIERRHLAPFLYESSCSKNAPGNLKLPGAFFEQLDSGHRAGIHLNRKT